MTFYDNAFEASPGLMARGQQDRQFLLRNEIEDTLRSLSEAYPQRVAEYWQRNYSSVEAYLKSVEGNRERWRLAVGDFGPPAAEMNPQLEPFAENDSLVAHWVTLDLYDSYRARAVLVLPKKATGPVPVVIAQHGIGSSPERVMGFGDDSGLYHCYGQRLAEAGYAVLAPLNVTEAKPRERLTRLCLMLGKTLWGLEINRTARLIDYLETRPEIDCSRIGMWGISLGGAYTIFTMPLEPRIKAGIITAWFNHRVKKMVIDDPRYSCFLSVNESHIFIPGWLREFTDSDLISLIAPRPVMSQTGKGDGIAWWPFVQEEETASREHYVKLGLEPERMEMDLHEGGHEIRVDTGLAFLKKWLV
jgi:dienelactone hydrolase